jgi:hypothetical protein
LRNWSLFLLKKIAGSIKRFIILLTLFLAGVKMTQKHGHYTKKIALASLCAIIILIVNATAAPSQMSGYMVPVAGMSLPGGSAFVTQSNSVASLSAAVPQVKNTIKPTVQTWQTVTVPAYNRQTWLPGDQLVSSYALLASSGKGFWYPGGMAASMGGGGCGGS